jgi:hypothetical protein
MKILIAGSRTITRYEDLLYEWLHAPEEWTDFNTTIISGCAPGVDTLAIDLAHKEGYDLIEMPADWKKHGRGAGFIRNNEMVKICDAALILWDGKSSGTNHTIELLKHAKKFYQLRIIK